MLTFDGPNRNIVVPLGTTIVDVQSDIYSAWKQWVKTSDNSKFLRALRTTGGDPFGGGEYLGAYFFLVNQWQLKPTSGTIDNVILTGNLKHDDGLDIVNTSGSDVQLWQNVVSSLTTQRENIIDVTITGSGLSDSEAEQLTNVETMGAYTTASLDNLTDINNIQTASLDYLVDINNQQTASLEYLTQLNLEQTASLASLLTINNEQTGSLNEILNLSYITTASLQTIELNTELLLAGSGSAGGLTTDQANQLLKVYEIMGLDPTKPLLVSPVARTVASEISQSISKTGEVVTVTRIP